MREQLTAALVRPLRLTFARVCIWCETRWCASPACVARHERSVWMVCPDCAGSLSREGSLRACGCLYGVVQAASLPAPVAAELVAVTE